MNDLSPREKNLWANIIIDAIALAWFAAFLLTTDPTAEAYKAKFLGIAATIALITIVLASASSLYFARPHEMEDMDERDHQIAYKGLRAGYWAFTAMAVLIIGDIYLNIFIPYGSTNFLHQANPIVFANTLLIALTIAALIKDMATLFYYRKGY